MNLEEQIRRHKEITCLIDELEAEKKNLGQAIMQSMTEKSLRIGKYIVWRYSGMSITTKIDEARYFNAVKVEEVVDKDKLKALYKSGQQLPGVKAYEYIMVKICK